MAGPPLIDKVAYMTRLLNRISPALVEPGTNSGWMPLVQAVPIVQIVQGVEKDKVCMTTLSLRANLDISSHNAADWQRYAVVLS
jgi:hypothetical protein